MPTAHVGSESDHRAEMEPPSTQSPFAGYRRYLYLGDVYRLLRGHYSHGLIRRSRSALLSFGLSLVRGVSAGCYQPLLPTGPSRRLG